MAHLIFYLRSVCGSSWQIGILFRGILVLVQVFAECHLATLNKLLVVLDFVQRIIIEIFPVDMLEDREQVSWLCDTLLNAR